MRLNVAGPHGRLASTAQERLEHEVDGGLQADPGCLPDYQGALGLYEWIGGRQEEANLAISLGNAYLEVPGLRDLDQAEHWYQRSLSLRPGSDQHGHVASVARLGAVALQRFDGARAAGEAEPVLLDHLNAALGY
jgi:hypothetical protein